MPTQKETRIRGFFDKKGILVTSWGRRKTKENNHTMYGLRIRGSSRWITGTNENPFSLTMYDLEQMMDKS